MKKLFLLFSTIIFTWVFMTPVQAITLRYGFEGTGEMEDDPGIVMASVIFQYTLPDGLLEESHGNAVQLDFINVTLWGDLGDATATATSNQVLYANEYKNGFIDYDAWAVSDTGDDWEWDFEIGFGPDPINLAEPLPISLFDQGRMSMENLLIPWAPNSRIYTAMITRFDQLTIPEPVPEPATFFLMITGVIGLAGLRKKKRDDSKN